MNARTRLAFFILKTHAGWIVRADGFVYPPCADKADALAKAIREAQAAERLGFASVVLAQSAAGESCTVCWCCAGSGGAAQMVGEARYPAVPAMADVLPPPSQTEERP
ncbi:hypothetical protein EI613_04795 [Azospirillum sp. 412522]|nr:hypothetical protein [Azospirillum sp. 412522]MBY6261245.1 hypothetical protein [Azospirillum sp. 412522]